MRKTILEGVIPTVIVIIWAVMFIAIMTLIVWSIVNQVRENKINDSLPPETLRARVVAKRTDTWGKHTSTSYYVTFETENGNRIELRMNGEQYGMLAEGDDGVLKRQGTRYLGFDRNQAETEKG